MLTPLEIQNKEFRRSFRGYNDEEVDSFLDRVNHDYEALYKENRELKERLDEYERSMARYKEIEEVMKNTLVMAQKNASDLKANAEKEAQLIVEKARQEAGVILAEAEEKGKELFEEARRRAGQMIDEAEKKVGALMDEYQQLEKQARIFRARFPSFLEAELKLLEGPETGPAVSKTAEPEALTVPA
ncbi:MAG: DivIVA domain-containing protein [Peptococcaceae bacterium]|nr:DivIVA domain-containing protein [Peptococcaceae bacterium]